MITGNSIKDLLGTLTRDITARTPGTGDFPTAVDGLELFRRNEPASPVSCLVPPSVVLVTEGAKIMWIGGKPYQYDAEKFLITSLDLPASSEVLKASASRPCVGIAYKLDQRVLMELIAQGGLAPVKKEMPGPVSESVRFLMFCWSLSAVCFHCLTSQKQSRFLALFFSVKYITGF